MRATRIIPGPTRRTRSCWAARSSSTRAASASETGPAWASTSTTTNSRAASSATGTARIASATTPPRCANTSIRTGPVSSRGGDMTMDPPTFRSRLGGVIAFPVTPFKPDLSLDLPGYRRNLQVLLKHKLCAIVAAGGTGELYSLTPAEHQEIVRATVEEVQGACPVIAGVGYNRAIGMGLAQASAAAGVDAILALPPYYPNADDEALLE